MTDKMSFSEWRRYNSGTLADYRQEMEKTEWMVVGFWYNDEPISVGVIEGHIETVHGGKVTDMWDSSFQGEWATSVTAPDADTAEAMAIDEMRRTLSSYEDDEDDDEDERDTSNDTVFEAVTHMALMALLFTEFDLAYGRRDDVIRQLRAAGAWQNGTGSVTRLPDGSYTVRVFGGKNPDDTV